MSQVARTGRAGTVGVVGTLVWDTIIPVGEAGATEDWGGIAYSFAALNAVLSADWIVRPIVKVGRDLEPAANLLLGTMSRMDGRAVSVVDQPNNRVELRYHDAHERTETLTGGVPPWDTEELLSAVVGCDALYLNFISGYEMSLATATELRRRFEGPMYIDLHSLFLGSDDQGRRIWRAPKQPDAWFELGDFVQLNRHEADLLAEGGGSLDVGGPAGVAVTEGPDGVRYSVVPSLLRAPPRWPAPGSSQARSARGRIVADPGAPAVDPTGCGDVWGGAFFAGLLSGQPVPHAAERATRLAEMALGVQGAGSVHAALASQAPTRERAP